MRNRNLYFNMFISCLLLLFLALLSGNALLAQSADDLVKKADSELRKSKNKLFSGRHADVYDKLLEVNETITAAQNADPAHPKLKKVITEFMKQKQKVEDKLGKELPITFNPDLKQQTAQATGAAKKVSSAQKGGAPAAPQMISGGSASKKAKPAKLPYDARYPMQQFKNASKSFDSNYKSYQGAATDMQSSYVKRMEDNLKFMKSNLQNATAKSAAKGVSGHADFDDAQQQINEAEKKYAALKTGHEQQVAASAATGQKIAADSEGIKKLYSQLSNGIFSKATGSTAYYNKITEVEPLIKEIENFERSDKKKAEKTLAEFATKYGDSENAIKKSTGDWQTANSYMELKKGIANVGKTREVMTNDLLKKYESIMGNVSTMGEFSKVDYINSLKSYLDLALRFSPGHPQAKKTLANHQGRIDKELQSFYAQIDKRSWPPHSANAPANKVQLAKAALNWFKNDPGWGQRHKNAGAADKQIRKPIAVSVKGPWSVQKTNLLGAPIMYGLPVLIAVELANEKAQKLLRVYDVTMRTAEKAGVKQAPPFVSITVGSSWYIRSSAL